MCHVTRVNGEREPQLVTLVGVPGIGKSRLVFELFKAIETQPDLVYWRRGRSLPCPPEAVASTGAASARLRGA
jgi:hypothetical protein